MKHLLLLILISGFIQAVSAQTQTIHIFVALCDNEHQGIVPVSESLGDGKDPANNLYWGAAYGVKSFFRFKTDDWEYYGTQDCDDPNILERVMFKHSEKEVYLLADAYDGEQIKDCIDDFLSAANGDLHISVEQPEDYAISFGQYSSLIAYVGHDGLMDFSLEKEYKPISGDPKDVMILACYSKTYFSDHIKNAQADPLFWTTHLMAPEAYTLKAAIDGWLNNESGAQIEERAAQEYNKYQKCGLKGARGLFTTGF